MNEQNLPVFQSPVPSSCRLGQEELTEQVRRYRRIGVQIDRLERRSGRLEIWLEPAADLALVERAIEIERECCPFYEIEFDRTERRLVFAVAEPDHQPALDAIQYALAGKA